MTKQSLSKKFSVRDVLISVLALAIIGTNYYWYQMYVGIDTTFQMQAKSWINTHSQISQLKNCINTGTKPCVLTTPFPN